MCNDIRPAAFPCQAENPSGAGSAFALARRCKADYDKTKYVTYIIFSGAVVELTYKWIALANRHYLMYLNKRLASYGLSGSQYLFILYSSWNRDNTDKRGTMQKDWLYMKPGI